MDEAEILAALAELGVHPRHWRLVLLLPMVQVAWADDAVQAPERERIFAIAAAAGLVDAETGPLLEGWLTARPSAERLALGQRVLVALAVRERGLGADLDPAELERVEALCLEVARSAGGLFDAVFTVSRAERAALAQIHDALRAGRERLEDLLPAPEGGRFEDL